MKKGIDFPGVSVVFFCHDGEGNFLFSKRSAACRDEHGRWDPGGGSLEFGDALEQTVRKEIREEYDTDVIKMDFLGFREVHREHDGRPTHWIAFDYKVLVDRTKVRNAEPHKQEATQWFRLDNLPSPLHSQTPFCLERYREKLAAE